MLAADGGTIAQAKTTTQRWSTATIVLITVPAVKGVIVVTQLEMGTNEEPVVRLVSEPIADFGLNGKIAELYRGLKPV